MMPSVMESISERCGSAAFASNSMRLRQRVRNKSDLQTTANTNLANPVVAAILTLTQSHVNNFYGKDSARTMWEKQFQI